jgi:hypothetical protein
MMVRIPPKQTRAMPKKPVMLGVIFHAHHSIRPEKTTTE